MFWHLSSRVKTIFSTQKWQLIYYQSRLKFKHQQNISGTFIIPDETFSGIQVCRSRKIYTFKSRNLHDSLWAESVQSKLDFGLKSNLLGISDLPEALNTPDRMYFYAFRNSQNAALMFSVKLQKCSEDFPSAWGWTFSFVNCSFKRTDLRVQSF